MKTFGCNTLTIMAITHILRSIRNAHTMCEKHPRLVVNNVQAFGKCMFSSLNVSEKLSRQEAVMKTKMRVIDRSKFRSLHTSGRLKIKDKDEYYAQLALKESRDKELVSKELFEDSSEKNRETFKNAIEIFNKRDVRKRGSVEFIYAALKNMKQFDCHR